VFSSSGMDNNNPIPAFFLIWRVTSVVTLLLEVMGASVGSTPYTNYVANKFFFRTHQLVFETTVYNSSTVKIIEEMVNLGHHQGGGFSQPNFTEKPSMVFRNYTRLLERFGGLEKNMKMRDQSGHAWGNAAYCTVLRMPGSSSKHSNYLKCILGANGANFGDL
jgi:hypothetical protein